MALVILTPQPDREVALGSDRPSRFIAPAGAIEITPATADLFARWGAPKASLLIASGLGAMDRLAGLEFQRPDFEFHPPRTGFVDWMAHFVADLICEELRSDTGVNDLYLESLLTVFSAHVLRSYFSLQRRSEPLHRGGLPARSWKILHDTIHAGLAEDLSIATLAQVANLSPSHFLRAFRQTTGKPPHQYISWDFASPSADRLIVSTDTPLADVARQAGFASHSHMSASTRRHLATTPSALRRRGAPGRPM